ncbi:unnamed protein product, partial [Sphacelaria rigidula]
NFIPNPDTKDDKCGRDGCSKGKCCMEHDDRNMPPKCNSIGCPAGYVPIEKAWEVECDDGECREKQCCESFCWGFACPENFIPNPDRMDDKCGRDGCSKGKCCMEHDD